MPGTINFSATNAIQDDLEVEDEFYLYSYYYYYPDAGRYIVTFTYYYTNNLEIANIRFTSNIRHGKAYLAEETRIKHVEVNLLDTAEDRDAVLHDLGLTFEEFTINEFLIDESSYNVANFTLRTLNEWDQIITLTHIQTNTIYVYDREELTNKEPRVIIVEDTTKPIIFNNGDTIIYTRKDIPYDYHDTAGIGTSAENGEVYATDNFDRNVTVTYTVRNSLGQIVSIVDLAVPDIYTLTYSAQDTSNNRAASVVRTVYILYYDYSICKIIKPTAQYYTGTVEVSAYLFATEGTNPNPTFYWFVDGEYVGATYTDPETSTELQKKSSITLDIATAGSHNIEVRFNNQYGNPSLDNPNAESTTLFVLLDNNIVQILIYSSVSLALLAIITTIIIVVIRKKRDNTYDKFNYKIYTGKK